MGTSWSARLVGAPEGIALQIQAELDRVVAEMSHWAPDSALSRFNRSEPGRWQPLPPGFANVLAAALDVAEKSDGAFDPAMGALVDLWGFGPPGPRTDLPDAAEVAAAAAISGRAHIEQDGRRARRTAPAALDFSGIAKGHGVDRVAEMLRSMEIPDFLVEIGGELRGEGIKPDGQPWWVDLEAVPGSRLAPLRAALHGLSVATSGDYRRSFAHAGRDYAHTLDPRTGRPLENRVASVTVLHSCCMLADAWATALSVLGPDGMALAGRDGLAVHMVLRKGAGFAEHLSPALQSMLG
ncbi:FAD:protein FMN transferase [Sphingomonas sp. HITSZ_GF]|uniref:FAD:protein FMN transferase n=1 Tax=Sphingomonas sp. HITSZ_GF TaxID=3037247 RepID=UPI00240D8467|nr:FAD:protein FMN transferase [Sphingomonas sp. HITSZ_GF]MDG2535526.1 FAD:protein FMN transferase [Sphingomonas sp. HITSZ_GF]